MMMKRKTLHFDKLATLRKSRGNAMVEFALVTTFILIPFFFVVSEASRAMYQYNTLVKSVQDGAMYLAKIPANDTSHDTDAKNLVACGGPIGKTCTAVTSLVPNANFTNASVTITRAKVSNMKLVTVSITGFNYTFLMKNPLPSNSATKTLFGNIQATTRQAN